MHRKYESLLLKLLQYTGNFPAVFNHKIIKFEESQTLSRYTKYRYILILILNIYVVYSWMTMYRFNVKGQYEKIILLSVHFLVTLYIVSINYKMIFHIPKLITIANEMVKIHNELSITDCSQFWYKSAIIIVIKNILLPCVATVVNIINYANYMSPYALIIVSTMKSLSILLLASIVPVLLIVNYITFVVEFMDCEITTVENHQRISQFSLIYSDLIAILKKYVRYYQFYILFHILTMGSSLTYELYSTLNFVFFRIITTTEQAKSTHLIFRINSLVFLMTHLLLFAVIINQLLEKTRKLTITLTNLQVSMLNTKDVFLKQEVRLILYLNNLNIIIFLFFLD